MLRILSFMPFYFLLAGIYWIIIGVEKTIQPEKVARKIAKKRKNLSQLKSKFLGQELPVWLTW